MLNHVEGNVPRTEKFSHRFSLEVEACGAGNRWWRYVVGSADCQAEACFVFVATMAASNWLRGATRGGLWSSFPVPAAGMLKNLEPYCQERHSPLALIGVVGVA